LLEKSTKEDDMTHGCRKWGWVLRSNSHGHPTIIHIEALRQLSRVYTENDFRRFQEHDLFWYGIRVHQWYSP
jgi:hypothetical protein